jgi:hypothetical protein
MTNYDQIITTITGFVEGGDTRNTALLDQVLHKDFRVSSNNFMGNPGVAIINKAQYLSNIKAGIFGGLPRKMSIESVDQHGNIAMVKIRLESSENYFVSYNLLVLDTDGLWKIIDNLAIVEPK